MPRTPPPKPVVEITPKPRTPSEWSPRSIPTPGVGRSIADPRTPRLSELAARERAREASLTADAAAWIGVRVLTPDGRPLAGCDLDVTAADGRAHGIRADADGHGRVVRLTPGECGVWVGEYAA